MYLASDWPKKWRMTGLGRASTASMILIIRSVSGLAVRKAAR